MDDAQKNRERAYFANLGSAGMEHSLSKPFSDDSASRLLAEIGACMALLPNPPARVVDLGCGTGWTSSFLARRGYDVLGLDLSPEAVAAARENYRLPNLRFEVYDFDHAWAGADDFDAALFFDSLHHAPDEEIALSNTYRMLKPGGVVVACEPGTGHAAAVSSVAAMADYGVRERDMPPRLILNAGKAAGFSSSKTYPHPFVLHRHAYLPRVRPTAKDRLLSTKLGAAAGFVYATLAARSTWGIVVLTK